MPAPDAVTSRQPTVAALWAGALLGLTTIVLGYWGFYQYLPAGGSYDRGIVDVTYAVLQLFVMGSDPLQAGGHVPVALQVARLTAPAVTLIAVIETARLLLSDQAGRLRARRARGHAVVCGDSSAARSLVLRLRALGRRVVTVRAVPVEPVDIRGTELLTITGDASDPDVLRGAGVEHADVVYAATDDSAANVSIAVAAGRLTEPRSVPTAVYAQVHDQELCIALQARRLTVAQPPGLRLDFFNVDELAARVLFLRDPLDPDTPTVPRLLIAGGSPFARAILVEAARQWRLRNGTARGRLVVDYVADDARAALAVLQNRYRFLPEVCQANPYELPLPILFAGKVFTEPHERAFICYPDEEQGLKVALTTQRLWHGQCRSVLVPLIHLAGLATAFHGPHGVPLLDEIGGALRLYPLVEAACDPTIIGEDLLERLGRLIHEHYLVGCQRRGEAVPTGALADWADLDDEHRRANRAQAADIGSKLHAIGCVVLPCVGIGIPFAFQDDEVELLAEREHRRWKAQQEREGWRPAHQRDDRRRLSPYLVDWELLTEDLRRKSRDAVRDTTAILADAGFDIVRSAAT